MIDWTEFDKLWAEMEKRFPGCSLDVRESGHIVVYTNATMDDTGKIKIGKPLNITTQMETINHDEG